MAHEQNRDLGVKRYETDEEDESRDEHGGFFKTSFAHDVL